MALCIVPSADAVLCWGQLLISSFCKAQYIHMFAGLDTINFSPPIARPLIRPTLSARAALHYMYISGGKKHATISSLSADSDLIHPSSLPVQPHDITVKYSCMWFRQVRAHRGPTTGRSRVILRPLFRRGNCSRSVWPKGAQEIERAHRE